MFAQLPEFIKQEILQHLKNNNFPAAKKLHDDWMRHHANQSSNTRPFKSNNQYRNNK